MPGDQKYLEKLDQLLDREINYDIIAVSAGFDGFVNDPMGSLKLTGKGYQKIGRRIARLQLPVFCVLEGGYHIEKLGENIHYFISCLES